MTFPAALVILLVFATGLVTGIAITILFFNFCGTLTHFRIEMLEYCRHHWPKEWDSVQWDIHSLPPDGPEGS